MKKTILFFLFISLYLLTLTSSASATLFSQPYCGASFSIYSNIGNFQVADDFILEQDSIITDLHWWGNHPDIQHFVIRFYNVNSSGNPEWAFFEERTLTGLTSVPYGSGSDYFYEAYLSSPVAVNGGETYFISILGDDDFAWAIRAGTLGENWVRPSTLDPWTSGGHEVDLAFELTGNSIVPLPSTLILLATGLIGLIRVHSKKMLN